MNNKLTYMETKLTAEENLSDKFRKTFNEHLDNSMRDFILEYSDLQCETLKKEFEDLDAKYDELINAWKEVNDKNHELKQRIIEYEDMSNKLTQIVASQKETFDALLKKYNALEQQTDNIAEVLEHILIFAEKDGEIINGFGYKFNVLQAVKALTNYKQSNR